MLFLSFVWLCILITELAYGTNTAAVRFWYRVFGFCLFSISLCVCDCCQSNILSQKALALYLAILVSTLRFFPLLQTFPLVRALTATFGMQVIWISLLLIRECAPFAVPSDVAALVTHSH